MKLITLLPFVISTRVKRMTGAEMEEAMPSKFWEPTATEISTRPVDTGDAIKAFLGDHAAEILKHGCHCSAFHDHFHNAHDTFMDPVDFSCQKWRAARTCIHLKGGPCHGQKHVKYNIKNGVCLEGRDTCAGAACMVDLFHQRIINMEISYNMHNEDYQNFVWERKQCSTQTTFDLENSDDILMKSLTDNGEGPTKVDVKIQKEKIVAYDQNIENFGNNADSDNEKGTPSEETSYDNAGSKPKHTSPLRSGHIKQDNLFKMVTDMKIERDQHQCCGVAPRFTKYNTSENTCENGNLLAIGDESESAFSESDHLTIESVKNDHSSEEESKAEDLGTDFDDFFF